MNRRVKPQAPWVDTALSLVLVGAGMVVAILVWVVTP